MAILRRIARITGIFSTRPASRILIVRYASSIASDFTRSSNPIAVLSPILVQTRARTFRGRPLGLPETPLRKRCSIGGLRERRGGFFTGASRALIARPLPAGLAKDGISPGSVPFLAGGMRPLRLLIFVLFLPGWRTRRLQLRTAE